MNYFDQLWTPQSDIPSQNHLITLIMIDIIILIIPIVIYFFIQYHIKQSIKGPAQDSKVIMPNILKESLRNTFLGVFLMSLSSLISHISGLFNQPCIVDGQTYDGCYLFIGQEDFFAIIGAELIVIGLYNFYHELTREGPDDIINFKPFLFLIIILPIFAIISILVPSYTTSEIQTEIIILLLLLTVIYGYLILKMFLMRNKGIENPLISLRKKILFVLVLFIVFYYIISSYLMAPRDGYYPTRNPEVELYLLSYHGLSLIVTISTMFIVFLPKGLLRYLGYDEEDLIRYTDYRFDEPGKYIRRISQLDESQLDDISNELVDEINYIFAYESDESMLIDQLKDYYNADKIKYSQLDEETLQKLMLPNVDIIYLDAHQSKNSMYQFRRLEKQFGIHISYSEDSVQYGRSYEFSDPNFSYAIIGIYPSYWNYKRKFWSVLFTPKQSVGILNFLKKYKDFLEYIAYKKQFLTLLLRFEKNEHGELNPIPPIQPGIMTPDPDYIEIM